MFLARVTGSVVATQKVASMTGHKLLTVEPLRVDPQNRDGWSAPAARFVVVDTVGAGQGEMVLIVQGSSARLTPETEKLPVDATIIGIVDTVNVENKTIFSARQRSSLRVADCEPQRDDTMQVTDELIRSVVQQVLASMRNGHGAAATGGNGQAGAAAASSTTSTSRRRRRGRGAARVRAARPRRPPQGRRLHPQDLHRAGRDAGPRGAGRNQDRPARAQDREAQGRRRPHPRRRVPAGPTPSAARTASRCRSTPRSASSASSRR